MKDVTFLTCNTGSQRSSSGHMTWGHWNMNIVIITIILIIMNTCRRTDWRTQTLASRSGCSCCRSLAAGGRNTPYCLKKICWLDLSMFINSGSANQYAKHHLTLVKYWMWIRDRKNVSHSTTLKTSPVYLFSAESETIFCRSFLAIAGESVTYQICSH